MDSLLIIGYGNTLRSDDGVGYRIAEQVAAWHLPGVRSLPLHQLTPELAAELAQAQIVIFVDAQQPDANPIPPEIRPLQTDILLQLNTHTTDPRSLLSLTQVLYNATPVAYQLLIPTSDFSVGETLSPQAEVGMERAIARLRDFISIHLKT